MHSFKRYKKINCEKCGAQTTMPKLARHTRTIPPMYRSITVCTKDKLTKLKDLFNKTEVIEPRSSAKFNKIEILQVAKPNCVCCST